MARYRKAAAVALNSAILIVEAIAGWRADSLRLLMDSVHNLPDEMALVLIYLAFVLPQGVSRHLLRSTNIFNSADDDQRAAAMAGGRSTAAPCPGRRLRRHHGGAGRGRPSWSRWALEAVARPP